jgi:Fic family protein
LSAHKVEPTQRSPLTVSSVHRLNAAALPNLLAIHRAGRMAAACIIDPPGDYRRTAIAIRHSDHVPPPSEVVDLQMRALFARLDAEWTRQDAAWLGGLVLWRINWIHPYREGNGRTARAACRTVVLSLRPQANPRAFANAFERALVADRYAYYAALRCADAAYAVDPDPEVAANAMCSFVDACIQSTAAAVL